MPKRSELMPPSTPDCLASEEEERAWLDMAPVGREFGSPDYDRLTALDQAAFAAFQSWEEVCQWLAAPNPNLDGTCPEDAARSPEGFNKVMSILMMAGGRASDDFLLARNDLPVEDRHSLHGLGELRSLKGMFAQPAKHASIEDVNDAIARRGAGKK